MPIFRVPNLNRKITIQHDRNAGVTPPILDGYGQAVENWVTLATVRASREDVGASERFRANQELATRTSKFTIRWRQLTAGQHRISHDGLIWDIEGLAEPENTRRQWLEITASAIGV